jgi:hypothetical protein
MFAAVVMLAMPFCMCCLKPDDGLPVRWEAGRDAERISSVSPVVFREIFKVACHGSGRWPLSFLAPSYAHPSQSPLLSSSSLSSPPCRLVSWPTRARAPWRFPLKVWWHFTNPPLGS